MRPPKTISRERDIRQSPQIWDNDEHIGGYEELVEYIKQGRSSSDGRAVDL